MQKLRTIGLNLLAMTGFLSAAYLCSLGFIFLGDCAAAPAKAKVWKEAWEREMKKTDEIKMQLDECQRR